MVKYRLREARTMKGLSLREAAKGLGVSAQYLCNLENKGARFDSKQLIQYANFYGVTVDYLVPNPHRPKIEFGEIKFFCKSKF